METNARVALLNFPNPKMSGHKFQQTINLPEKIKLKCKNNSLVAPDYDFTFSLQTFNVAKANAGIKIILVSGKKGSQWKLLTLVEEK